MGVRGLTTYIERNKYKYFKKHNLRDCHVVIDGNSLCAQLYKYNAKCNDVFGGDYDKFAKCIETFFSMLKQCNVTPIVIFDGGYEAKKLRTVNGRLQNKLKLIRNMNPVCSDSATIFPLFLREAFKDTLLKLNIPLARCDYEADLEIACVARQLNCPVLSYDSDFFIFDCLYIPFTTMDFHVTRITEGQGSKYCINCNLYDIELFLKRHRIEKPLLPLMATLLGNDYVKKSVFTKFYNHLKLPKKNGTRTPQYRTIIALLNWLQNESYDTAVKKILGRVKRQQRFKLGKILLKISQGYFASNSEALEYLGFSVSKENSFTIPEINTEEIVSENEDENDSDMDTSDTNLSKSENEDSSEEEEDLTEIIEDKSAQVLNSELFKKNVRNGNFPTLFIDILTLNLGIYIPQIEDTSNIQSFYIFLPILQGICKILLQNTKKSFYYLARNEQSRVKKYTFKVLGVDLPTINKLEKIDKQKSQKLLMNILNLPETYLTSIQKFPAEWQLYILTLLYWVKRAKIPKVTYNHVSCIILCLLHLNIIDKTEPIRKKEVFQKKFDAKLKTVLNKRKEKDNETQTNDNETQTNLNDLTSLIQNVSDDDILFFIDSFVGNFEIDEKLKTNKNLFSIHIVDAFAQFQSCLLHMKYLNALLNSPISTFDICQFFNGTFIYNLYANFEKRSNTYNYVELLLKNSPSMLCIYNKIFNILNPILTLSAVVPGNKKTRKRKRKKKTNVETIQDSDDCEENAPEMDVDKYIDENNIFSILSIVE